MERIILAAPRGFCAGVAYAIEVVDLALKIHGAPLYVRHAIVHNEHVVRSFEERGVIFVEDIDDIPTRHARRLLRPRRLARSSPACRPAASTIIDATCPLVTKVHNEAKHYAAKGYFMIYIGHDGHVEAEGTMGEAPGRMVLVETPEDAEKLQIPHYDKLSVLTQTTLSVDEVRATSRRPQAKIPAPRDAQERGHLLRHDQPPSAIRELAQQCDLVLIVGSPTSSNSNRLREVAESLGTESHLLLTPDEVQPNWRTNYKSVGISSGASTPESLVEEVIGALIHGRRIPVRFLRRSRKT